MMDKEGEEVSGQMVSGHLAVIRIWRLIKWAFYKLMIDQSYF